MQQDRPRLEHALSLVRVAVIHHCRDLGVGIRFDKAAAELVSRHDVDEPRIVLRYSYEDVRDGLVQEISREMKYLIFGAN